MISEAPQAASANEALWNEASSKPRVEPIVRPLPDQEPLIPTHSEDALPRSTAHEASEDTDLSAAEHLTTSRIERTSEDEMLNDSAGSSGSERTGRVAEAKIIVTAIAEAAPRSSIRMVKLIKH